MQSVNYNNGFWARIFGMDSYLTFDSKVLSYRVGWHFLGHSPCALTQGILVSEPHSSKVTSLRVNRLRMTIVGTRSTRNTSLLYKVRKETKIGT